jgi:acetyl esterase/lipase
MKRDKQTPWKQLLTIWTTSFLLQDVICMVIYVVLLLPGFLQMAWFYVKTDRISVRYKADSCRNSLDVYSNKSQQARPVVLFLPGGAFLIGYKMWAALLAQALAPAGILVIAADYRNYPFGTVPDMVQDVEDVLEWTFENCEVYGGDPKKVVLVGQSAGAHLGIMALLRRQWDIKGFIGLSGVYDLRDATKLFGRHGLSAKFVKERLFDNRMTECDPTQILREEGKNLPLPPIEIWHGTADKTVRHTLCVNLNVHVQITTQRNCYSDRLAFFQTICIRIRAVQQQHPFQGLSKLDTHRCHYRGHI